MKTGKKIQVMINGKKVLITEVFLDDITRDMVKDSNTQYPVPCIKCFFSKFKNNNESNSPSNCLKFAPSCMSHKREDKRSIYYKITDDANKA